MALTRNFLKALGLTDEQIGSIVENHMETVDALKKERDGYRAQADSVGEVAKERDELKAQLEKAGDIAKVQAEFDAYRTSVEKRDLNAKKRSALDAAFKAAGVSRETFRNSMLKAWDMETVELDDSGAIKDIDGLNATVQKDYGDFIATNEDKPLPPNSPPGGGGHTYSRDEIRQMTPEEINKNWDAIRASLPNMK